MKGWERYGADLHIPPSDNPRLTRGKYWLLETVAELRMPVRLLDDEEMDFALNKEGSRNGSPIADPNAFQLCFMIGLIQAFHLRREQKMCNSIPQTNCSSA